MLITGDKQTKYYTVTNPVAKKKTNSLPSFKGHVLTEDEHGRLNYIFNLPNAPANTKIQFAILQRKKDGSFELLTNDMKNLDTRDLPKNGLKLDVSTLLTDPDKILGYRFLLDGKHIYHDYTKKNLYDVNQKEKMFNIAMPINRPGHTLPRQMEHLYPDSVVPNLSEEKRNHFNHLGGSISEIINKLDYFKDFGIRRILGTPIFGQDTVSSHGYWTANPYQITETLGNFNDFQRLQKELFKRDMGWVADGAFVNEGMQGIHIKDILTWGEESPFINWFDTTDVKNNGIKLGVFSKQPQTNKHIHIKLINAPYRIDFEKTEDGYKEKAIFQTPVNSQEPTYIQIFDDRLVTDEQVKQQKIFNVYGRKNAPDKHEINNYKDSAQPYVFRVSPKDVKKNFEKFKELQKRDPNIEFKDTLRRWSNFELVESNEDAGISLWVGNSDIAKKRFMIAPVKIKEAMPDKRKALEAAQYQVQDDTIQVGKFWTSEVSRTLVSYTAEEIGKLLNAGFTYEEAIKNLIKNKKLPKSAELVFEKINGESPLENILTIEKNGERSYRLLPVETPQNITDGLMSYPLEGIEFSPDLTSILAYPYLKNFAVSEDTVGKSRYELYEEKNTFYKKLPSEYLKTYSAMDNFIADDMTDKAVSILQKVGERAGFRIVQSNGKLTEEGKEFYALVAPEIAKFLYISTIAPTVHPKFSKDPDGYIQFEYNTNDLKKISAETLGLQFAISPEAAAQQFIEIIKERINQINEKDRTKFIEYLAQKAQNVDSDTINVARLIVQKSESGLDWRIDASKDVGDWDNVEAGIFDEQDCYDRFSRFWVQFNKNVRKFNPKAYTIGEMVLDMNEKFVNGNLKGLFKQDFISRTNFTTTTDYNYMYGRPLAAYGTSSESQHHEDNLGYTTPSILNDSLFQGFMDDVNFAHTFSGNHDKPRILHTLAVKMYADEEGQGFLANKAQAVKNVMLKAFDNSPVFNEHFKQYKTRIYQMIGDLAEGRYSYKNSEKFFPGEEFGVRPFDQTIDDVFQQATLKNMKLNKFLTENPDLYKKVKAEILEYMLRPALTKYTSALFYMVGMPGNPTVYGGDELGETGWESIAKNATQNNRSRLHFERLEDSDYEFIQKYNEDLKNILNIRNQKGASALINGATIPLASQKLNPTEMIEWQDGKPVKVHKSPGDAGVVYRYNDKTDAICVFHNAGYGADRLNTGMDCSLPAIYLDGYNGNAGLPNGLEPETLYYDAQNPNNKYKVVKDGNTYKIINTGGGDIPLGNRGIILLREYSFSGEHYLTSQGGTYTPNFRGRNNNPYVQLANMKFNIANSAQQQLKQIG